MSIPCDVFRSSVTDSLPRLTQTKWAARPLTTVSRLRARSPPVGASTLITRAPKSASVREHIGAETACSSATTVTPANGADEAESANGSALIESPSSTYRPTPRACSAQTRTQRRTVKTYQTMSGFDSLGRR